jgi:hypothetical protein
MYDGGIRRLIRVGDTDTFRADIDEPADDRWLRALDIVTSRTPWAKAAGLQFIGSGAPTSWVGRRAGYVELTLTDYDDSLFALLSALIDDVNREAREDVDRG